MLAAAYIQRAKAIFCRIRSLATMAPEAVNGVVKTQVLPVEDSKQSLCNLCKQLGVGTERITSSSIRKGDASHFKWNHTSQLTKYPDTPAVQALRYAAEKLKTSNIPIAFPTETVYGLGADATRSEAVKGIYKAKGRPSDNPLIIHVSDLNMLREILSPREYDHNPKGPYEDPIPEIYYPLIERFWPGPLTIILPNPEGSKLAPEVTAGLKTFGARMPNSTLALLLIKLAGVPIAAPSANASTKPSPTLAEHVLDDLDGRIELILDGGPCMVGVESTIADGLSNPPVILRPGGISINQIRECKGWEKVQRAYKDDVELEEHAPRAPGMKYKHYSPKAKVILAEGSADIIPKDLMELRLDLGDKDEVSISHYQGLPYMSHNGGFRLPIIGVVRTRHWAKWGGWNESGWAHVVPLPITSINHPTLPNQVEERMNVGELYSNEEPSMLLAKVFDVHLGVGTKDIAQVLFLALRELDKRNADLIFVEGIDDDYDIFRHTGNHDEGNMAAAIMNRLRKAATVIKS